MLMITENALKKIATSLLKLNDFYFLQTVSKIVYIQSLRPGLGIIGENNIITQYAHKYKILTFFNMT